VSILAPASGQPP